MNILVHRIEQTLEISDLSSVWMPKDNVLVPKKKIFEHQLNGIKSKFAVLRTLISR